MQTGGMVLLCKVEQCIVQHKMNHVLDNSETHFEQFTLSLSDYIKGKISESEILIHDRLFDVKSFSITGNTVQLLVVNDAQEEEIVEKIKELTTNMGKHGQMPSKLLQLLTLTYIMPTNIQKFFLPQEHPQDYSLFTAHLLSTTRDVSSPPPKLL